ncbi:MAG: serine/threonine-protein phosphatase [Candidatus Eisenbacteria bacterium]|uniref:Serine/threonine-protein phosphatase n=1 Tax=Eiseniibacteriota bacterium TaxID=2212470 RepID=A0A538SBW8_UNCEI|nr:MAG: serine/threonine-protein phosphatase [Candidatus Eisenbacteria bacterium]
MPNPAEQAQRIEESCHPTPGPVRAEVGALSHRGRVRDANEDAFAVFRMGRYLERVTTNVPEAEFPSRCDEAGHVMIVADGLGGHEAGDVASRSALVNTFQFILRSPRWVLKLDDPATREAEIQELFERSRSYLATVHDALRRQASGDPRLAGMGTTLTVAYLVGRDLFVVHVGDSKAYLIRGGTLRKITRDHTVAQEYADLGMISQEEVASHRMHHVLTRAVGGPEVELEGDMHLLAIEHGDRLLLCSDGLTDMASEPEIAAVLEAQPTSDGACRALVDLALERGGRDNVTVIVAGFTVG